MVMRLSSLALASALATGCGLSPTATPSGIDGGLGGGDAGSRCPQAFVVVDSDYNSTNISVISTAGSVLSASVLSSASSPPGLTEALSGDVIVPLSAPASGDLVLIDQTNNAIDWIDPTTASVIFQLSVATGFKGADPSDYLEVAPSKAYVTRYNSNPAPGKQPFDAAGDILIVDTATHTITGRIDLSEPDDGTLFPTPDRMLRVGGQVWVSLERFNATDSMAGEARIVLVDPATDQRTFTLDLTGLQDCGDMALSPSGAIVAVTCTGGIGLVTTDVPTSGIVLLDATKNPPVELERFLTGTGGVVGPTVAFASETLLVSFAYGDLTSTPPRNDVAFTLDTTTGAMTTLVDAGAPFVLGDVRCTPGCANECAMADAHANGVRFWDIGASGLTAKPTVAVDPKIGLPPRGLGEL